MTAPTVPLFFLVGEVQPYARSLAELERVAANDSRLCELAELCTCGHDRGDHLDAQPHACDGQRSVIVDDETSERRSACTCARFERRYLSNAERRLDAAALAPWTEAIHASRTGRR